MSAGEWLLLAFFGWLLWRVVRRYGREGPIKRGRAKPRADVASGGRLPTEGAVALGGKPVYRLEYIDADGVITQRDVTPSSQRGGVERTTMWCHLRRGLRTFRYDRMNRIVRLETGAILTPSELYAALLGHTPNGGIHAPLAPRTDAQECWDTYEDVLTLLAFVGKADNRFVAKEKAVIRDFIVARGHSAETADILLKRLARVFVPTTIHVNNLMRRIAAEASPGMRRALRDACRAVAGADGVLGDAERDLLARVDRLLMTE